MKTRRADRSAGDRVRTPRIGGRTVALMTAVGLLAGGAPSLHADRPKTTTDRRNDPEDRRTPLESLIAAERAFAASSPKLGVKAAFLAVLAEDSVLFHPGPVNGREWQQKQPDESGGRLTWYPSVAFIAESCDLGYTTGPFEFRPADATDPAQSRYGHFVSLWRRESPRGAWRLVCDLGVSHPKIEPPPSAWLATFDDQSAENAAKPQEPMVVPTVTGALLAENVAELDAAPEGVAKLRAVRERWCGNEVRFYRPGRVPIVGRDAVLADEAIAGELLRAELQRLFLSDAGDFAATISGGTLSRAVNGAVESRKASVVRFWQHPARKDWRLVLEILNLEPPAKKD